MRASSRSAAALPRGCSKKSPSACEAVMIAADLSDVSLDDKYTRDEGRIYLTGVQALVRLPLVQRRRDRAAGLNTAGFISGYRGSPLGGYDTALGKAKKFLTAHDVIAKPAVNED